MPNLVPLRFVDARQNGEWNGFRLIATQLCAADVDCCPFFVLFFLPLLITTRAKCNRSRNQTMSRFPPLLHPPPHTDRACHQQGLSLWVPFQNSATAVTNLYKGTRPHPSSLHPWAPPSGLRRSVEDSWGRRRLSLCFDGVINRQTEVALIDAHSIFISPSQGWLGFVWQRNTFPLCGLRRN